MSSCLWKKNSAHYKRGEDYEPTVNPNLTEWEAELLRRLINEVEMLDQFLDRIINYNGTKSLMFRNVNFLFMYCLIMFKSIAVSQDFLKIQLIKSQTCNKCIPSLD